MGKVMAKKIFKGYLETQERCNSILDRGTGSNGLFTLFLTPENSQILC